MEQAISACEDLVHDARRILAGLYERDLDASSPSEDSHGDADGNAGDEDGDEDGDDDDEDDDEDDDDGSGASEDDSQGDDDEEEVSSASDAESSGSDDSQGVSAADSSDDENSEPDDLVPDYAQESAPPHLDRAESVRRSCVLQSVRKRDAGEGVNSTQKSGITNRGRRWKRPSEYEPE